MDRKWYFLVSSAVFLVLAFAHLTRLVSGWEISVAGWNLPRWVSLPGLLFTGGLSAWGFSLARRG